MSDANTRIQDMIDRNDVVLFMKGTPEIPQCGFSSRVAGVLNYMGVPYEGVNVLSDADIRQGIKDFSDWPTIPQLYVKGEFVGGCDIITEMTLSGELDQLLEKRASRSTRMQPTKSGKQMPDLEQKRAPRRPFSHHVVWIVIHPVVSTVLHCCSQRNTDSERPYQLGHRSSIAVGRLA